MTIAYLNVATDPQQLDIQREEILSFSAAKGIQVDKWVIENQGEKEEQAESELKNLLGCLEKGDVLIVSDISRLSFTLYELIAVLTICLEKETTLYCINDGFILGDRLDRPQMVRVLKMMEEIDHNLASIRTKDALAEIRNSGKPLGRPKGSESKLYYLDSRKDEVKDWIEKGKSVDVICQYFNVSKNTFYKYKRKLYKS